MARARYKESRDTGGTRFYSIGATTINNSSSNTLRDASYCEDVLGPGVDHPLWIEHVDCSSFNPLNGELNSPGASPYIKFEKYSLSAPESYSAHAPHTIPGPSGAVTTLLARTNPSRPDLTPLTLIQDLYDLPKMLRELGRLRTLPKKNVSAKDLANWHLSVRFGWLPLIHDLKLLLDFQKLVTRRANELKRLDSKGGLKRRITLDEWSFTQVIANQSINSYPLQASIVCDVYKTTQIKRWGTVRWKPTSLPPSHPSDEKYIQEAQRLVSGLTLSGLNKGAWDVLPWTWLTDWFVNIGDYMAANYNSVPASPGFANVMTQKTTTISFVKRPGSPSWLSGGDGTSTRVTKERYVGAGSLPAGIPFLGASSLSILGSLAIQRSKR